MRTNMILGYFVLGLAVVLVAGATALVLVPRGSHRHLHCVAWVTGPTPVYACSDGHSYARVGHELIDLGTASRGGLHPAR